MITSVIVGFFGASCLASIVVFAACAASARADEIQRQAFSNFYEEADHASNGKRQQGTPTGKLALNL